MTPSRSGPNPQLMLETSLCDLHWSALHIGVIALLMNPAGELEPRIALRPWRHVLFQDSEAMLLALKFCGDDTLPQPFKSGMTSLYAALQDAKTRLTPLIKPTQGVPRGQIEAAQARWAKLAGETATLLKQLRDFTRARAPAAMSEDSATLVAFLEDAAHRRKTRRDAMGGIILPALKQRRATPRVSARGACRVNAGAMTAQAELIDISQRGMGLRCAAQLTPEDRISVELPDGREISAKVMRREGDRFGLRFDQPLSPNDPLLRAA